MTNDNPVFNIWMLKNKDNILISYTKDVIEKNISEALDIIEKEEPDFFKRNSKEHVINTLRVNYLSQ